MEKSDGVSDEKADVIDLDMSSDSEDIPAAGTSQNTSQNTDRNPEPPQELLDKHLIDADNIGDTVFSKHWLFMTLMKLIEAVDANDKKAEKNGDVQAESTPTSVSSSQSSTENLSGDTNSTDTPKTDRIRDKDSSGKSPRRERLVDAGKGVGSDEEDDCVLVDLDEGLQDELCRLWDMSMNQEVVEFLLEFNAIEILTGVISKSQSPRATEISVGILGNMACNNRACQLISCNSKLVGLMLLLLQSMDAPTLVEATRLLQVCLANPSTVHGWAVAIHNEPSVFHSVNFMLQSSTSFDLLRNVASFVDKLMDVDVEICEAWSDALFVSSLLEATKQIQNVGSETYERFLHILQLLSTSEEGVQTMVDQAERLSAMALSYLHHVCAEDIVALEGKENATGSAISILAVVFASWPDRDTLITEDVQLMRCLLKILEIVYIKYHNMQHKTRRSKSLSAGGDALVDLTEEDEEGTGSEDGEKDRHADLKKEGKEKVNYQSTMVDMLYEVLQNFMLDIIAALNELSAPSKIPNEDEDRPSSSPKSSTQGTDLQNSSSADQLTVIPDTSGGDPPNAEKTQTQDGETPEPIQECPKSLKYLDAQCDHLRINYMVYIVKDFDGETCSLIEDFHKTAIRWNLERLARYIYISNHRDDADP